MYSFMLSQRTFLLFLVMAMAVSTTAATDADISNANDTTPKRKRVRRHRNVLQIPEADVSAFNSLWEQDGFGRKNKQRQQQHSRTLKGEEKGSKGMMMMGEAKKGMGMMEKGSKGEAKKKGMGMMAKGAKKDKAKAMPKTGSADRLAPVAVIFEDAPEVTTQSFSFYF
jgi:hypothetical protein